MTAAAAAAAAAEAAAAEEARLAVEAEAREAARLAAMWAPEDDLALLKAVHAFGNANWQLVADAPSLCPTCNLM